MEIESIKKITGQAQNLAEAYQKRCESAESILVELVFLPWWRFGEKRRLRKKFEQHYKKFIDVSFLEFINIK